MPTAAVTEATTVSTTTSALTKNFPETRVLDTVSPLNPTAPIPQSGTGDAPTVAERQGEVIGEEGAGSALIPEHLLAVPVTDLGEPRWDREQ